MVIYIFQSRSDPLRLAQSGFGGNFIGGRINAGGLGAIGGNANRSISGRPSLSYGLGNFGGKGSERSNNIVGNGNGSSNSGSLGPFRVLTISSDVTCIGGQPLGDQPLGGFGSNNK